MSNDFFPSAVISRIVAILGAVGYLEVVTATVVASALGVAYVATRETLAEDRPPPVRWLSDVGTRVLLGAIFFVMGGLNGFLQFVPQHPSSLQQRCPACHEFLQGLAWTGYLPVLIKGVELIAGLFLILGLWVPLMLLVLAPIVVNILLYHAFLNPQGIMFALLIAALTLYLAYRHREVYLPLLRPAAAQGGPRRRSPAPAAVAGRHAPPSARRVFRG